MAVKHARAIAHLTEADPVLGRWIAEAGPCGWSRENAGTHFDHISRSIVYQQLSGAAASTIYGRVLALYGGATPTPAQIARTSDAKLRAVGLSTRKVEYIKDLARHTHAGTIPVNAIHEMEDAEVCCGFGGTFCVKYPEISEKIVEDKVRNILASGADTLLGGDLGCLMNIAGRLSRIHAPVKCYHTAEVLAGMAGTPVAGKPDGRR